MLSLKEAEATPSSSPFASRRGLWRRAIFPRSHKLLAAQNPDTLDLQACVNFHHPHPEGGHGGSTLRPEYQPDMSACVERLQDGPEPVEFCGAAGDVLLMHGRMFHSCGHRPLPRPGSRSSANVACCCTRRATPNYSVDPPTIRQMALYDVLKQSTYDSFYAGYQRGPRPSPPPNPMVRERYGLERGPLAPRTSTLAVRTPCPQTLGAAEG